MQMLHKNALQNSNHNNEFDSKTADSNNNNAEEKHEEEEPNFIQVKRY